MAKKKLKIRDLKHAREIARTIADLRESMRTTKKLEAEYATAVKDWMKENHEDGIEQEGCDTLRVSSRINGYEWDCVHMPDDDLALLRKLGLLTVRKGEYDEAVKVHGPLGLLNKWATPHYSETLWFEKPPVDQPRDER